MKSLKYFIATISLCIANVATAKEEINIVWGFNLASNQAVTIRGMIEELNKKQDKFRFQLVHRPGAGGTVAANSVTASPNNTIVAMSSSFIIRPYFEKEQPTQDLKSFIPILVQGTGSPLFMVSKHQIKIQELLKRPGITIAVGGVGSISHLVANEIATVNPSARVIFFQNMVDAGIAAAGGHVDSAIGYYVDLQSLVQAKKLNVLGYTGNKELPGFENLLLTKTSVPTTGPLTASYAMFASTAMTTDKFQEIRALLSWVNKTPQTLIGYAKDQMIPADLDYLQTLQWYDSQRKFWQQKVSQLNLTAEKANDNK
jgi:tripartite-type tricarboxylate transporter receptor subunit TctC